MHLCSRDNPTCLDVMRDHNVIRQVMFSEGGEGEFDILGVIFDQNNVLKFSHAYSLLGCQG